ncbi:Actin, cytoplasmic [Penaeus vannamei]|uniref:Actin, cytoplasmic n=1 Tax=Penaeus vannamei TaxID=6689 RepID=A0A3R7QJN9_PENVA|nr:Actin, cytoplasmic [Penaeus vannamei]
MDIRKEMSRSIFLAGGVTHPRLTDRLTTEIDNLTPPAIRPKVHASPYRYRGVYRCVRVGRVPWVRAVPRDSRGVEQTGSGRSSEVVVVEWGKENRTRWMCYRFPIFVYTVGDYY